MFAEKLSEKAFEVRQEVDAKGDIVDAAREAPEDGGSLQQRASGSFTVAS